MSPAPVEIAEPPRPPVPLPGAGREAWMLDPEIVFLNHGCFGARPRAVFEAQSRLREAYEARPVQVLDRRRDELVAEAKAAVGAFAGMRPEDFGFVTNATDGVNAVLRSLDLEPGDELVTTDHVYNAVRMAMRHVAARAGATSREIPIPLPLAGPDEIVERVEAGLSPRTRLLVIDHVTSMTALRVPVEAILALAAARGIDVLVDGAHAPAMIELDVSSLGAAYYAANLHKWACAPSGAAVLWVRPDRQAGVEPTTVSHFAGQGLAAAFGWQGTRDVTPWLAAPEALRWLGALGWDRVRAHNHALATWAQAMLAERWDVEPLTPRDGSMLGSMAALPVPAAARAQFESPDALHDALYDRHGIEVPVFEWGERWLVRPSCHVYTTAADLERLADAMVALAAEPAP